MSSTNSHDGRVLIVDDEENVRLTLSEALREMALDCCQAATGAEALDLLESETFDLMLLDIKIPEPDGMEVLRWAREHRPFMSVIVITAYGTPFNAVEAVQIGAADFIRKPFSVEEIHRHAVRILSQEDESLETARYDAGTELGSSRINDRQFDAAAAYVYEALRHDGSRPDLHDLLGILYALRGSNEEAKRCFERALSLDLSYAPALRHLRELSGRSPSDDLVGGSELGE